MGQLVEECFPDWTLSQNYWTFKLPDQIWCRISPRKSLTSWKVWI